MSLALSSDRKVGSLLASCLKVLIASQSKISGTLTLVLVMSSAWVLGELAWFSVSSSSSVTHWSAPKNTSRINDSSGFNVSGLLEANIFGEYSPDAGVVEEAPVVSDAPKTRLDLVLVGAVASSNHQNSLAVIANKGTQSTYGIGETIEGTRAKLKAVLIDRVIIDNAGRDETLMLQGIDYSKATTVQTNTRRSSTVKSSGNNPELELDTIKQEITEDPQKLLQYIQLSQMRGKDGKLVGYRVRPGKNKALFESVGLRSGDVATHLNGEDLTDAATMGRLWKSLSDLTEINLTVERKGQTEEIYIQF